MPFVRTGSTLACTAALALLAAGCWNPFSPDQDPPSGPQYFEFCDSAYKVVENLHYAYIARDLDRYMDCFRSDFEFHLLQVDWDDYNGDGIIDEFWGLDLEEQLTELMFDNVFSIELTFTGTQEYPWEGDPTGESLQLPRVFDLKVYTDGSGTQGYRATGTARFICRPDTTSGEYYIWQWYDESDV